jgi:tetratricopeptide (TPR) repeat protein
MSYLQSAHEIYKKEDDVKGILNTLYELAVTYYEAGQDDEVLRLYETFLEVYLSDFSDFKYKFLHLIGDLHHRKNQQEEALKFYYEILNHSVLVGDSTIVKEVLKKIAEIAYITKNEKTLFYVVEKYLKL